MQDSLEADNKYNENNQLVLEGLQKILDLINNGSIKRNEIKIIDSIKNISQAIMNEKYYTTSNSGNIVPSDYTGFFNKLFIDFNKNPSLLKLDDIDNILNELYNATYNFDLNNNEKFYQESIGRTKKLYSALNKIYNLGVDYQTKKKKTNIINNPKQGQGLKILTPKQMLSRLPILLAQSHAENNNSAKLKNEIRQLLYSLYRSKKISKTVHNNLIATI